MKNEKVMQRVLEGGRVLFIKGVVFGVRRCAEGGEKGAVRVRDRRKEVGSAVRLL